MRPYVVIEPHSDDAYLSIPATLRAWIKDGADVQIVTVYGSAERIEEATRFCDSIGAAHFSIGLVEAGAGLTGDTLVADLPPGAAEEIRAAIPHEATQVWPLGLQHHEHRAVAALAPEGAFRYVESPYQFKLKLVDEVAGLLVGRSIVSIRRGGKRAYNHHEIFRTQSMFMHYNPPETMARTVELIVR